MQNAPIERVATAASTHDHPISQSRLIRLPEVMDRVGLGRSAIYQRMRDGTFPRSRSLGSRCAVWIEDEINDWIEVVKGL